MIVWILIGGMVALIAIIVLQSLIIKDYMDRVESLGHRLYLLTKNQEEYQAEVSEMWNKSKNTVQ